jgi:hypothetical protein
MILAQNHPLLLSGNNFLEEYQFKSYIYKIEVIFVKANSRK